MATMSVGDNESLLDHAISLHEHSVALSRAWATRRILLLLDGLDEVRFCKQRDAILAAIEADRRRSYAALGLSDEGEAPSSESAKRR